MPKTSRSLSCAYLHADGTLVQIFDEKRDHIQIGQTADITYGYTKVNIYERYESLRAVEVGRIVIHRYGSDAFVPLAKGGRVLAKLPNRNSGSEKTKELGYDVQYVELTTKAGLSLSWSEIPGILGSSFTVQAGSQYTVKQDLRPGELLWSGTTVNKVTDLRKAEVTAA